MLNMQIWILVAVPIICRQRTGRVFIADRNSYPTLSVFFPLIFMRNRWIMPAELTIVPVKELFLQIRLATNPPASLDTVKAAEIREP